VAVRLDRRPLDHSERTAIMAALTWMALAGMMVIAAFGTFVVVVSYGNFAALFPDLDFTRARTPLCICAIAFGFCVEVMLTVSGILVGYVLTNRVLHPPVLRLVNALVVTIGVATLLVVAVTYQAPPFRPFAMILCSSAILGGTILLALLFVRSALVRAASLQAELDEVV
jgi:hypothetical protein